MAVRVDSVTKQRSFIKILAKDPFAFWAMGGKKGARKRTSFAPIPLRGRPAKVQSAVSIPEQLCQGLLRRKVTNERDFGFTMIDLFRFLCRVYPAEMKTCRFVYPHYH